MKVGKKRPGIRVEHFGVFQAVFYLPALRVSYLEQKFSIRFGSFQGYPNKTPKKLLRKIV